MRKFECRWLKRIVLLGLMVCGIDNANQVWTDCDYCQNLTNPLQLCMGIGSSTCGLYYTNAQSICCSNTAGKSCSSYISMGQKTFYYRYSDGNYCNGYYKCANRTYSPCIADVIIPSSHNCLPTGPVMGYSSVALVCM